MSFALYLLTFFWLCLSRFGFPSKEKKSAMASRSSTSSESPPAISPTPDLKPYELPPLRDKGSAAHGGMGLKRLDAANWLTIDQHYLPENALRANLLQNVRPKVLQCLPGAEEACREVLEVVVDFLTSRFPQHFSLSPRRLPWSPREIHNHLTGESHVIGPSCPNPLEMAVRLAMEDFNILMRDPATGHYALMASATLFPAGWKLQERIGTSMANLHGPVPLWKEKLSQHVERYFNHLTDRTAMERTNLFIQTTGELFQDAPETLPSSAAEPIRAEQCMVRRERQTFSRLPKSGAVLFTVRSFMEPLTGLTTEETKALLCQIQSWDEAVHDYKGWSVWGEAVEGWCVEKGKRDEQKGAD